MKRRSLKRAIFSCLVVGIAGIYGTALASGTLPNISNTTLPDRGNAHYTNGVNISQSGNSMTINQGDLQNAVIQWGGNGFNVGANATVNFQGNKNGYNVLNYDTSGKVSSIYGTINANNNGNVYLVNANGVQIGNSAQINVGSLTVSSADLSKSNITAIQNAMNGNIASYLQNQNHGAGELMSLGNINSATTVTFDGDKVVLDADRLKNGNQTLTADKVIIQTSKQENMTNGNIIVGYTGYEKGSYAGKNTTATLATVKVKGGSTTSLTKQDGYMWVTNGQELQAINTNVGANYALRNSIDLNASSSEGFTPIGSSANPFTGKFEGLGQGIYGLTISSTGNYVGLFGYARGATIRDFNIYSGSISGGAYVGSVVGKAENSTIADIVNTVNVTGTGTNTGGLIGESDDSSLSGLVNTGKVVGKNNTGGLVGSIVGGELTGSSSNLGSVQGTIGVGGITGSLSGNGVIGNSTGYQIYNNMKVTGEYNVGGIAGIVSKGTIQNVANKGTILATGFITEDYTYHSDVQGKGSAKVQVANVGGIAGNVGDAIITDVLNEGDVSTQLYTSKGNVSVDGTTVLEGDHYSAGNVGGIVGRMEDSSITNAENKETNIRGAHNVGGIAGYMKNSTIKNGNNNNSDIMATGARNNGTYITEEVRYVVDNKDRENFIIGNIGGIAGYVQGDNSQISDSVNRGNVHSQYITDQSKVAASSQAANAGGIAGKVDKNTLRTIDQVKQGQAVIYNSYNVGNVSGYTGVGGVAGMMFNGEIANAYNLGTLKSTRTADKNSTQPLNMGGVLGDGNDTINEDRVRLYNVYNKGQIGDETYTYYGRHVGGVVGRLSGTIEKAYNQGDIYNGFNVVGGVVGYFRHGSINNIFNTGNITVQNYNTDANSQVGGLVGTINRWDCQILNGYNLGTLRSFQPIKEGYSGNDIGGIIGEINNWPAGYQDGAEVSTVANVYTMGNILAGEISEDGSFISRPEDHNNGSHVGAIIGSWGKLSDTNNNKIIVTNAYYIKPEHIANNSTGFYDLSDSRYGNQLADFTAIDFNKRYDSNQYKFDFGIPGSDSAWRIYENTMPILNAFLGNSHNNTEWQEQVKQNGGSIQFGTAYNPTATIITSEKDVSLDWGELGVHSDEDMIVIGGGNLTIEDFTAQGIGDMYNGTIYTDGTLSISGKQDSGIELGSFSSLYGSSITVSADGTITIYGEIIGTGSAGKSDVTITSQNGDIISNGEITTIKQGDSVTISGINSKYESQAEDDMDLSKLLDPNAQMDSVGVRYSHTTQASQGNGNVTITANNGDTNIYFGHLQDGFINSSGDISLTGNNVYVDSDLSIGGNFTITSKDEIVWDLSHIGQYIGKDNVEQTAKDRLHDFLAHFANGGNHSITFNSNQKEDVIIALDFWDYDKGKFDFTKYDSEKGQGLSEALGNLNFLWNDTQNTETPNVSHSALDFLYIWVSTAEQLKGIQEYVQNSSNGDNRTQLLQSNIALKNDIDASDLEGYEAIASGEGQEYTGHFNGRENKILGLTVNSNSSSAGIFGTIGETGLVEGVDIYSSSFKGKDYVGTIAAINKGTVENILSVGNHVEVTGSENSLTEDAVKDKGDRTKHIGAAGGIVGVNYGDISGVHSYNSVIAATDTEQDSVYTTAGGIAGINLGNIISSDAHAAVAASQSNTYALGGITGINGKGGKLDVINSYGVVSGLYGNTTVTATGSNIGGIAGMNYGSIDSAYNEGLVEGYTYVGGIVGQNYGTITNIVNASKISGLISVGKVDESQYIGGIAGSNSGTMTTGRNNGEISGGEYVGGLVGKNEAGSKMQDLINDSYASITGNKYVGGLVGANFGTITNSDTSLINKAIITGNQYVGGIAGSNSGTIENTTSDISLEIKAGNDENAQYFGGVTGENTEKGTITNVINSGTIIANGASYVGGIVGYNKGNLTVEEGSIIHNSGTVIGKDKVGGIIGYNEKDLIGTEDTRLVIENNGRVEAVSGGAGGIIGAGTGDISYADLTNTGDVIGKGGESGTGGIAVSFDGTISHSTLTNKGNVINTSGSHVGGIFGTMAGTITGSSFANEGVVIGQSYVGGIFGTNSATITGSSLKNNVYATVVGTNYVGGIAGENTGSMVGGRNEANTAYTNMIYNNGTIFAGSWTDTNHDGIVDEGELSAVAGSHIGGLVGRNEGTIGAAYNTGRIDASLSTNVGGIAGSNSGNIDQVFNTILTPDKTNQYVQGATNVGGIVGSNEAQGTISNTYNTSAVIGNSAAGILVGSNSGTLQTSYGTAVTGEGSYATDLVGSGSAGTNSYLVTEDGKWTSEGAYEGFDFESGTWKIYEGQGLPLLKIFLTKLDYNGNKDFTYNGSQQGMDTSHFTPSYGDLHDDLLGNLQNTNAGDYIVGSAQIGAAGEGEAFDPNRMGYDVNLTYTIDKAKIDIDLGQIDRVYGDTTLVNGTKYDKNWTITITNGEYTEAMIKELENLGFKVHTDGAVTGQETGRVTSDAGDYTWSGEFSLGDLAGNYEFASNGSGTAVIGGGVSTVAKKKIEVNLGDVSHIYGNSGIHSGGYEVSGGSNGTIEWVNGDDFGQNYGDIFDVSNIKDNSLTGNSSGKVTGNVGDYTWTGDVALKDNNNYEFVVKDTGKATIEKGSIVITGNDQTINKGQHPSYNGTISGVTNGDTIEDIFTNPSFGITDTTVEGEEGTHEGVIGFWENGTWYGNGSTITNGNYDITVIGGTLTVIPEVDRGKDYSYFLYDSPFKENDKRERKAEIIVHDGGMIL